MQYEHLIELATLYSTQPQRDALENAYDGFVLLEWFRVVRFKLGRHTHAKECIEGILKDGISASRLERKPREWSLMLLAAAQKDIYEAESGAVRQRLFC